MNGTKNESATVKILEVGLKLHVLWMWENWLHFQLLFTARALGKSISLGWYAKLDAPATKQNIAPKNFRITSPKSCFIEACFSFLETIYQYCSIIFINDILTYSEARYHHLIFIQNSNIAILGMNSKEFLNFYTNLKSYIFLFAFSTQVVLTISVILELTLLDWFF